MLGPALLLPAARIALSSSAPAATSTAPYPAIPRPVGSEASFDGDQAAFASALEQTAKNAGGGEGFFDFLGPIINTAIKVAPIAIGAVGDIVKAVGSESTFEPLVQDDLQPHVETLCHRALLGDAVLRALVKVPVSELQHQESFFGGMLNTVKSIAATAIKVAPSVVRVVEPIVHQLIQQKLNGESSLQPGRVVDNHHSLDDWLNDDSVSEMPSVLDHAAADTPAPLPKVQQNGVHSASAVKMVKIPIGKAIAAF